MSKASRNLFKSSVDLDTIHEYSEILEETQKAHRRSLTCGKSNSKSPARRLIIPHPSQVRAKAGLAAQLSAEHSRSSSSTELRTPTDSPNPLYSSVDLLSVKDAAVFKLDKLQPQVEYQELLVYSQVFDDIIKQDNLYGGLLMKVKDKYDAYIRGVHLSLQQCERKHRAETQALKTECTSLKQELDRVLQSVDLQKTEDSQQAEVINRLSKDLRSAKIRETKHLELLKALKQLGAPVDEVYQRQFKKPRNERVPRLPISPIQAGESTDCSSISPSATSSASNRPCLGDSSTRRLNS